MRRLRITSLLAALLHLVCACNNTDTDIGMAGAPALGSSGTGQNGVPFPTTGVGGIGGTSGSSSGNSGSGSGDDCLPIWDPGAPVKVLGRVLLDGSATGVLRPGAVNVSGVQLFGPTMVVTFITPMPDVDYAVFAAPTGNGKVVTFVPRYVSYDLELTGFKMNVFNLKGEPISWEEPTSVEAAFAVF